MSALECIAHVDELYIRSYPLKSGADAYGLKLIDFPVTIRLAEREYYMRYRRGWDRCWKLFCSDDQLLALRKAMESTLQLADVKPNLDAALASLFDKVDAVCTDAVRSLPAYPTRRDVLQHLIEQSLITPIFFTIADDDDLSVHFFYLGGQTLLAVLGRFTVHRDVMAVCELDAAQWRLLCNDIQRMAPEGREQVDALVLERVGLWMAEQDALPPLENAA